MEIANCRWCGGEAVLSGKYHVESLCGHKLFGPSAPTVEEAIKMWNEMMNIKTTVIDKPATLECTSTDYRDRVDRMAAAILAGYYANPDNDTPAVDTADDIAETAAMQIGSIDRMLKEREASL